MKHVGIRVKARHRVFGEREIVRVYEFELEKGSFVGITQEIDSDIEIIVEPTEAETV